MQAAGRDSVWQMQQGAVVMMATMVTPQPKMVGLTVWHAAIER